MESFRRQREEELDKQYGAPPTETYTSTTVITKSVECHEEHNGDEDTTVVTESTEVVEEEYMEVIFWLTFTDVCHNIHWNRLAAEFCNFLKALRAKMHE